MLMPRQPVPALSVPLLGGGQFDLQSEAGERGTVVCFYRGLHCPICATYLKELEKLAPQFAERGYGAIAISSDGAERTQAMADKIEAENLRFGYDLALGKAREWGLYISTSRGKTSIGIEEPALFSMSLGCLSSTVTARSITCRSRPCRSSAPISASSWAPSILPSTKATRRVASMRALFKRPVCAAGSAAERGPRGAWPPAAEPGRVPGPAASCCSA